MKTYISIKTVAFWLPLSIVTLFSNFLHAQKFEETNEMMSIIREDTAKGLVTGIGLGLDFSMLSMINPRPNEGKNATNIGGLLNFYAYYTGKKTIFDTKFNMQIAAQRLGASTEPFVKTADVFQLNMIAGRKIRKHLYWAGMADMRSQFFFTYGDGYLNSNNGEFDVTSEPFSPVTLKLMPGMLYRPNADVKFLLSFISSKMVIVTSDYLAAKGDSTEGVGILGNTFNGTGDFKNINSQWGAELRGEITKKLFKDRVIVSSVVDLYSNYLKTPENVAFEWYNSVDLVVFKNLSINLKSDWFYDHNVLVNVGGDPNHLGRRMSIRNAAFLKFNAVF